MHRVLAATLNFLFPQYCASCGRPSGTWALCGKCRAALLLPPEPACPICGLPFPGGESHVCGHCLTEPPHFSHTRTCTVYGGHGRTADAMVHLLHRFKYGSDTTLAPTLASFLLDAPPPRDPYDLVLPVPLHPARLRRRGFNQAILLARPLARKYGYRMDPAILVRTRPTRPQVELENRSRKRNVAGAFAVRNSSCIRSLSVLLVDDVYTTGATLNECARVLRTAGADRVDVLVLARALLH